MRSDPCSPSTETAESNDSMSWWSRFREWILTYGLHIETLLAVLVLMGAIVTLIVVFFGAITSLPTGSPPESGGTSGILGIGTVLINSEILLTAGLGVFLVIHGVVELWSFTEGDVKFNLFDSFGLAYFGVRIVQSISAVVFVSPILVGGTLAEFGVVTDEPPATLILVLLGSGLLMLVSVLAHASGRVACWIIEP